MTMIFIIIPGQDAARWFSTWGTIVKIPTMNRIGGCPFAQGEKQALLEALEAKKRALREAAAAAESENSAGGS